MKRLLVTLLFLLGSSTVASAMDSVKGWCEEGNRPVVTSGLNSTTRVQASHPSCIITVYVHGGGLATIYADNNLTPLANPFTAQSGGRWQAYSQNGRYDVTMSSAGFSQTVTYSDIILCDPFETGSTCNNGGTVQAHNLLSTTHLDTVPESPPVRGDLITAQNTTSPSGVTPAWAALPIGIKGQVLLSTGIDAVWGSLVAGTNITIDTTTSGQITISASGGGGSGCTLPAGGVLYGVVGENPKGTCDDSNTFTWNKTVPSGVNGYILSAGDGSNTISGAQYANEVFMFGDQNIIDTTNVVPFESFIFGGVNTLHGCTTCALFGDGNELGPAAGGSNHLFAIGSNNFGQSANNNMTIIGRFNTVNPGSGRNDTYIIGEGNTINSGVPTLGYVNQLILVENGAIVTAPQSTARVADLQAVGSFDTFTVGIAGNVALTNEINCIHGVGSSNTMQITAGNLTTNGQILSVQYVGRENTLTANNFRIDTLDIVGSLNTINATGNNLVNASLFGQSNTLANCSNCFIVGQNVSNSTTGTMAIGMTANAEVQIASTSATNGPYTQFSYYVANASSTGTTVNKLAKLTGAPSTAVLAATTDTADMIGVVVAGAGTTGNALVAFGGMTTCVFDGATTAGHYVQISSTVAGDCHDAGATLPGSGQVIGRVLSTNGGGGTYKLILNDLNMLNSGGGGGTTLVASGTSALGTGAITSGTCATVVTTAATGALTTDNLSADFNADPTSTTGYQPSASGMLTIVKYITANNVNFKVCNNTSGSITPGAVTLQWRVIR